MARGNSHLLAGAAIRDVVPTAVAESGNVTVRFDALSYAGTLTITTIADPHSMPELVELETRLRAQIDTLIALSTALGGALIWPITQ